MEGHWKWSDFYREYFWIKGQWIRERSGHFWVSGFWEVSLSGFIWVEGYWGASFLSYSRVEKYYFSFLFSLPSFVVLIKLKFLQ